MREPYSLDLERVMEAAKDRGWIMEVNAQPAGWIWMMCIVSLQKKCT